MAREDCHLLGPGTGVVEGHNVPVLSHFQEPDYGALYEGRNPGFYVEANPMPTFKVLPRTSAQEAGEGPSCLGLHFYAQGPSVVFVEKWCLWFSETQEVVRGVWLVYDRSSLRANPWPSPCPWGSALTL